MRELKKRFWTSRLIMWMLPLINLVWLVESGIVLQCTKSAESGLMQMLLIMEIFLTFFASAFACRAYVDHKRKEDDAREAIKRSGFKVDIENLEENIKKLFSEPKAMSMGCSCKEAKEDNKPGQGPALGVYPEDMDKLAKMPGFKPTCTAQDQSKPASLAGVQTGRPNSVNTPKCADQEKDGNIGKPEESSDVDTNKKWDLKNKTEVLNDLIEGRLCIGVPPVIGVDSLAVLDSLFSFISRVIVDPEGDNIGHHSRLFALHKFLAKKGTTFIGWDRKNKLFKSVKEPIAVMDSRGFIALFINKETIEGLRETVQNRIESIIMSEETPSENDKLLAIFLNNKVMVNINMFLKEAHGFPELQTMVRGNVPELTLQDINTARENLPSLGATTDAVSTGEELGEEDIDDLLDQVLDSVDEDVPGELR